MYGASQIVALLREPKETAEPPASTSLKRKFSAEAEKTPPDVMSVVRARRDPPLFASISDNKSCSSPLTPMYPAYRHVPLDAGPGHYRHYQFNHWHKNGSKLNASVRTLMAYETKRMSM